jgi:hypothetical protein
MGQVQTMSNDTQIPQLQIVTDVVVMKDLFQAQLPAFAEGALQIEHLKLLDFGYEFGKKCQLCYKLRVNDLTTGREGSQILFGLIEPDGGSEARYAQALQDTNFQPEFGPAVHLLPELHMVLWGFPNDPALKHLHRLFDDDARSEIFQKHWNCFHCLPSAKLAGVETEVVKYNPQDRCTLRHEIHLQGDCDLTIYSKTFNPVTKGELIFKIIQTIWNAPVCQSGELLIPEPLFMLLEMNTIFTRGLVGLTADECLAEIELDAVAAEAGIALAGIHQCHIEGLPSRSDQHALSQVTKTEKILANFDGSYKARVEAIAAALREKYPGLTQVPATPIHSAFRLSQFLLVEGKLALVDFDNFLLSNPLSDVASFVAHLLYLPVKGKLSPEQSRSAIRQFCLSYAKRAPWGFPDDVLAWQVVAQLVGKQVNKCIKRPKKHSHSTVNEMLNLAEDILAGKLSLI